MATIYPRHMPLSIVLGAPLSISAHQPNNVFPLVVDAAFVDTRRIERKINLLNFGMDKSSLNTPIKLAQEGEAVALWVKKNY